MRHHIAHTTLAPFRVHSTAPCARAVRARKVTHLLNVATVFVGKVCAVKAIVLRRGASRSAGERYAPAREIALVFWDAECPNMCTEACVWTLWVFLWGSGVGILVDRVSECT